MASQRGDISTGVVVKMALGGLIGGLITFVLIDPQMREVESASRGSLDLTHGLATALSGLSLGIAVGAAIGGMLVLAEEVPTQRYFRLVGRLFAALVLGGIIGLFGVLGADMIFAPFAMTRVMLLVIVGRTLGWAFMGIAAALCPGILSGSLQRAKQAAMGGFAGGAIGGILFDLLGSAMESGSLPRLVGFGITGLAIGAASALVTEIGKVYWLTALSGSREGKSYYLAKPQNTIGRNELADIPVFGDSSVLKDHAVIRCAFKGSGGSGATLLAAPGATVLVNGMPIQQVNLSDGDVIQIARNRYLFSAKAGMAAPAPADGVPQMVGFAPSPMAVPMAMPSGSPMVMAVSGPHAGTQFSLFHGAIVGRDMRCDVPLTLDTRLSRQHARFIQENGLWWIEDGGSTNGTFVNGVRITRQQITPGCQIQMGETVLSVS